MAPSEPGMVQARRRPPDAGSPWSVESSFPAAAVTGRRPHNRAGTSGRFGVNLGGTADQSVPIGDGRFLFVGGQYVSKGFNGHGFCGT